MTTEILLYSFLGLVFIVSLPGYLVNCRINPNGLVYPVIWLIFFPVNIQILGRDAITTGILAVTVLFLFYLADSYKKQKIFADKHDVILYLLMLCAVLSTIIPLISGSLPKDQFGPAVRQLVSLICGLMLYTIIKNYRPNTASEQNSDTFIESTLNLLVCLISLHIVISTLTKYFPSLGSLLSIFYGSETDSPDVGDIIRSRSFVFTPERYGELLATLCPVIVYKIMKYRNPVWLFALFIFAWGLVISVTRSGIILFALSLLISLLYYSRRYLSKVVYLMLAASATLSAVIFIKPSVFKDIYTRSQETVYAYSSTGDLFVTINRDDLPFHFAYVMSNLLPFGHSLCRVDYHNLYLTSLHQLGVIGCIFFFAVLAYPVALLLKSLGNRTARNKDLVFACLVAMLIFFINEAKFEFTRVSSYMGICWAFFGLFYLVAKSSLRQRDQRLCQVE